MALTLLVGEWRQEVHIIDLLIPLIWSNASKVRWLNNKKAELSQRWPRDAPYIWVHAL